MNVTIIKGQRLIWLTLFISVAMCVWVYTYSGMSEETVRACIRYTARISFVLFSFAFVASALFKLSNTAFARFLLQNRRYIGLSFGVSHLIHLVNILALLFIFYDGDINGLGGWKKLAPAISIYVFIFAMMITSNDYSMRVLGAKVWTALHKVGMYAIALGLGGGFYKVVTKEPVLYSTLLALLLTQISLRITAWVKSQMKNA